MEDTIVAQATAPGVSALAVIRVSGPLCLSLVSSLFVHHNSTAFGSCTPRYVYHVKAVHNREYIDDVCITFFEQSHSYTGLDCLEITCHGGLFIPQRIIDALIALGCRLAEPGEFTRLRFLSGKIDLTQAEAVIDLIHAKTELAHAVALKQITGSLSQPIRAIREQLVTLLAQVEAGIDFSDQDIDVITPERIQEQVTCCMKAINVLLSNSFQERQLQKGIKVGILGCPNSGKSSLFNALLNVEKAIVSPHPGTTRDILEAEIIINGCMFILHDSAGLRDSKDGIEQEGIRRAHQLMKDVDRLLYVLDAGTALHQQEKNFIERLQEREDVLFILNKIDLPVRLGSDAFTQFFPGKPFIEVSCVEKRGIQDVAAWLFHSIQGPFENYAQTRVMINTRHKMLLEQAVQSLVHVCESLQERQTLDILAVDLTAALTAVSQMTGDGVANDVLDHIFSAFCIGK